MSSLMKGIFKISQLKKSVGEKMAGAKRKSFPYPKSTFC